MDRTECVVNWLRGAAPDNDNKANLKAQAQTPTMPPERADNLYEAWPLLEHFLYDKMTAVATFSRTSSCECTARSASSAISLARSLGQPACVVDQGAFNGA